ncbi:hypothetical protein F5Y18DRAFT_371125 [Xylariaceae sp. FL1019]|nr:hypothetical protein F5Y18DRAFT_371125 [Xylariaceae sp. FL1019]
MAGGWPNTLRLAADDPALDRRPRRVMSTSKPALRASSDSHRLSPHQVQHVPAETNTCQPAARDTVTSGMAGIAAFLRGTAYAIYTSAASIPSRLFHHPPDEVTQAQARDQAAAGSRGSKRQRAPDGTYRPRSTPRHSGTFSVDQAYLSNTDSDDEEQGPPRTTADIASRPFPNNDLDYLPPKYTSEYITYPAVRDVPSTTPSTPASTVTRKGAVKWGLSISQAPVTDSRQASTEGQFQRRKSVSEKSPEQHKETNQYKSVKQFFNNHAKHSLPGLEDVTLSADPRKVHQVIEECKHLIWEEELRLSSAILEPIGLRRPRCQRHLVDQLPTHWEERALHAPQGGKFDNRAVHSSAVPLQARDFQKLVPPRAWLNDDCITSSLACLAVAMNKHAGVKDKVGTPKCMVLNSLYWKQFLSDGKPFPRTIKRQWTVTPENFHNVETVLIPVNHGLHWTLMVIRPSRMEIAWLDSFHSSGEASVFWAHRWLQTFLEKRYNKDDWQHIDIKVPSQSNGYDCGVFVITNAMCMAMGLDPMIYNETDLPRQRLRIAAMLLNGGFTGDFSLEDYMM